MDQRERENTSHFMTFRRLLMVGLLLLGIMVTVFLVTASVAVYAGKLGRPISWRFPQGFRGWVVMRFEDPDCAPIAKYDMYLVMLVTASGQGCTSTALPEGWRYVRYEYIHPNGKLTKLRADGWNTDSMVWPLAVNRRKKEEYLFVGTQEELNRSWSNRPDR